MWRNYLKVAVRAVRRRPLYAVINVFGLAVGMATCILIGLYVFGELSYDEFHAKSDRIYQMGQESQWGRMQATPYPLATAMEARMPELEAVVRTWAAGEGPSVVPEGSRQG
jgi:putative ABC transport system permease protein